MKMNRKGNFGFPEAMIAVMVVTLSLTAYIGVLAISVADEHSDMDVMIDERMHNRLSLDNDGIVGDIENDLITAMERYGYRGITVKYHVPGYTDIESVSFSVGSMEGDLASERTLFLLNSYDGRKIPAIAETIICA